MLSRSGLSIRKFIPHRRLSDEDLSGGELNKDASRGLWTDQETGNDAIYAANRHPNRRKQILAPIIVTSPLTHSDILRPLPPIPSETPRSSASSSCRCERHVECDCPLLSMKRRSPLYSITSKEDGEDISLLSCVNNSSPDDTVAHHIPKSRFCLSGDSTTKEDVTRGPSRQGEHKEEESKHRQSEESLSPEFSQDIQQFMQETEDAFKAIGSTLSEVPVDRTAVSKVTKADSSDSSDVPRDLEPTPPTPPPKETRLSLSNSPGAKAPSTLTASPPNTPPKDSSPIQRPKRKKSKKSKHRVSMKSTRKTAAPKQAVKSGPRWTLSENVSELLTGKLFHRIEADEMLTPDQIEAFKQQRITKLQVDKMAAALENELADTPIEPFHLEDLPSRIGSAGVKTGLEEEKPAIPFSEDVVPRNFLFGRLQKNNTTSPPVGSRPTFHKNNTFPTTSSRHVRSSSRKLMTELPIIPESITTPRVSDDLSLSNASDYSLCNSSTSTSEYVYFKSSPYSIATPAFQHGPIRLSKSDLVPDMSLGSDEGLDWTAYQMAILGGAGDLLIDNDVTLYRQEEEEIADLAEWWDSFHFESTGDLVTRNCGAPSPTSTLSGDEIPDLPPYSEIDHERPKNPHQRWQEAQRKTRASGLQLDISSRYFANGQNTMSDTWRQDSEEKQVVVDRQSLNSLPPSPMLDLRVIRSDNGDDLDVVPMGYNLGHDLGDFLKWEAQHAYAGDFNSRPD